MFAFRPKVHYILKIKTDGNWSETLNIYKQKHTEGEKTVFMVITIRRDDDNDATKQWVIFNNFSTSIQISRFEWMQIFVCTFIQWNPMKFVDFCVSSLKSTVNNLSLRMCDETKEKKKKESAKCPFHFSLSSTVIIIIINNTIQQRKIVCMTETKWRKYERLSTKQNKRNRDKK